MGHTYSKRKREKRLKRELSDYILNNLSPGDDETLHRITQLKINRLSADLERLSIASSYLSKDSVLVPDSKNSTMSLNRRLHSQLGENRSSDVMVRDSFSFEKLNVDDDPALTKLQNEQNRRLEKMEARMSRIREHAMQEAERRKFAHMFRAKNEPTTVLLHKAKDTLVKDFEKTSDDVAENKTALIGQSSLPSSRSNTPPGDNDKGEIIPVTVISDAETDQNKRDNSDKMVVEKRTLLQTMPALNNVNLNDPKSYLFLPFLFPIFVIFMVLRGLQQTDAWQQRNTHTRHKKRE